MTKRRHITLTRLERRIFERLPAIDDNLTNGYTPGIREHLDDVPAAIEGLIAKGVARWDETYTTTLVSVPGIDWTHDQQCWRWAEREPGPDPLTDVEVMAISIQADVPIPPSSTLMAGWVRRDEHGRWIAETGSGETLQALPGRHETAEAAEAAVQAELVRRIEEYATLLERDWSTTCGTPALPCPLGLMGRHVRTITPRVQVRPVQTR